MISGGTDASVITRSPAYSSHSICCGLPVLGSGDSLEADKSLVVPLPQSDRTLPKKATNIANTEREAPVSSRRSPHPIILSGPVLFQALLPYQAASPGRTVCDSARTRLRHRTYPIHPGRGRSRFRLVRRCTSKLRVACRRLRIYPW